MDALILTRLASSLATIQAGGVPALRIASTLAVVGFAAIGRQIYRRRHLLFDRDPDVDNDFAVVRQMRLEGVLLIWSALMLVLVCICIATWRA